jgi:ABC-type transport system substrate-binding protein/class 3 adenylate cyclase
VTDGTTAAPTDVRTFLIADIRGYTRFTQANGDEAGARLAARFAAVVREQVGAAGGTVVELRGDEALCVFGSPRGAVRGAVELQRRCADELRADASLPLRIGVGIDAGEAVPIEGGYRGGAVNLAARLCSLAAPGEVLVSEAVVHLARKVEGLEYVDRGRSALKGLEQPVRVMQVQFDLDLPPVDAEKPRRPSGIRLAALAGAALTVVVAAVILAVTRSEGRPAPALQANAVGSVDPAGLVSSQVSLPLSGRPAGIAGGAGKIWATDAVNGSLIEIDPSTGAIVNTLADVGTVPAGVAVGGGGVWIADSGGATVRWINAASPGKGKPAPIQVGQGPGPIAYGLGAAWVVNTIDGTLQRIGADLKASRPIPIGASPTAVAVGGGSVWVTDTASNSVVRVDAGGRVTERIGVGDDPVALAYGDGDLWVANAADGTLTRIDPRTDAQKAAPVGGRPVGVAVADGSVWAAVAQPDRIARVDPRTLKITETALTSPPQAITTLDNRLWITSLADPATHRGGTLRVLFGAANGNSPFGAGYHPFDPGAAPYAVHFSLLHMTNDGLVALRPVGGAAGGQVVPDLAVALPAVSDGGMTYTFRLRRGIRYSNGEPVRPSDFRFAIERQFLHPISYGTLFLMGVRGASVCASLQGPTPETRTEALKSRRRCRAALARGIVPDDNAGTVTIHLVHPDVGFIYNLTTTFADLLPPDSPSITSGKPVPATGPYMIEKATAQGATLIRNPRFHVWSAAAQPAGFPNVVRWVYTPNDGRALTEVEHGQADVMLDEPPPARSAELRTTYATLVHPYIALATNFLAFNTRAGPFTSVLARRAVNFAIDRGRIVALTGGPTTVTPTCQVLPPTMFGYRPYCPYTTHPNPASGAWSGPNMARALALVRASGTRGARVDLRACGCDAISRRELRYVGGVLSRLGYHVALGWTNGYNSYGRATANPRLPLAVLEGWVADYPYPTDFFGPLLSCGSGPEPGIKFCDPHLDAAVRAAEDAQGTAAVKAWHAADIEAVDQAPWAALTNDGGIDVIGRRVGNYQRNPQWGEILDQLWVR